MSNKLFLTILLSIIILSTFENKTKAYPLKPLPIDDKPLSILVPVHQCHQQISVTHAFSRASVGKSKNAAVYMNIGSKLDNETKLIGARTKISTKASLHNHLNDNGVLKMRPVKYISIPAGGSAELKPGGYHVMLMGLKAPLTEGTEFNVELIFEGGETREVAINVLAAGAMGKRGKKKHTH